MPEKDADVSFGERSVVSNWLIFALVLGATYALLICWMAFEVTTAPLLDTELRVISDPHHRMSPRGRWRSRGRRSGASANPAETV
jgi:hypothetical protein